MRIILIVLFSTLLLNAQNNWQEQLRLARYYEKSSESAEALKFYEGAWNKSHNAPQVYSPYFNFLNRYSMWQKGLEISEKMYNAHPKQVRYIGDYAKSLMMTDQKDKAMSLFSKVLARKDFRYPNLQTLANVMLQSGMFSEAINFLENGYSKYPKQISLLMQIASLYQGRLAFDKASEYFLRYLDANPVSFSVIQSRILNMLDNWEDANDVLKYILSRAENDKYTEIRSAIYLKFKKYDLAFPLLTDRYSEDRTNKYRRYLQYASQARTEGNTAFALRLLDFLQSRTADKGEKNDIFLTRNEILYTNFSGKSPIDSINVFMKSIEERLPEFSITQKTRAEKLFVNCYHYLLNDLDNGITTALIGLKESRDNRYMDYFYLELIKMSFEKGAFATVKKLQNRLRSPENLGESGFYGILAGYKLSGIKTAEKELKIYTRKTKPDHPRFNNMLDLKSILSRTDSLGKTQLLNAYVYYLQKKYALAENEFSSYIEQNNSNMILNYISAKILYEIHSSTLSSHFYKSANTIMQRFQDNPANAKLLWQLSKIDSENRDKYYQKIMDLFPESIEADKLRDVLRDIKGKVG